MKSAVTAYAYDDVDRTFACRCGHMHGRSHCAAMIGERPCSCHGFVRAERVRTPDGTMARAVRGALVYETPDLYLALYGLRNPMVCEAIRLGALVDVEPIRPRPWDAGTPESATLARRLHLL